MTEFATPTAKFSSEAERRTRERRTRLKRRERLIELFRRDANEAERIGGGGGGGERLKEMIQTVSEC